jgi:hypothetical protein
LRAVAPDRNCTSIVALLHCYSKPQTRHNKYAVRIFPYFLGWYYYIPISKLWRRIILVKLIVAQIAVYRTRRVVNVLRSRN